MAPSVFSVLSVVNGLGLSARRGGACIGVAAWEVWKRRWGGGRGVVRLVRWGGGVGAVGGGEHPWAPDSRAGAPGVTDGGPRSACDALQEGADAPQKNGDAPQEGGDALRRVGRPPRTGGGASRTSGTVPAWRPGGQPRRAGGQSRPAGSQWRRAGSQASTLAIQKSHPADRAQPDSSPPNPFEPLEPFEFKDLSLPPRHSADSIAPAPRAATPRSLDERRGRERRRPSAGAGGFSLHAAVRSLAHAAEEAHDEHGGEPADDHAEDDVAGEVAAGPEAGE